jgi:hypothetical protein
MYDTQRALMESKLGGDEFLKVVERVASGDTQRAIAALYGVNEGSLSLWLSSLTGARAEALAAARKSAAPALVGRALASLDEADRESSGDVSISIARAKTLMQLAGLADRRGYSERPVILDEGGKGAQPPSFSITILNGSSNQTVTIQQDTDLI